MCEVLIQLKTNCRRSKRHKFTSILYTDGYTEGPTDGWTDRWILVYPRKHLFCKDTITLDVNLSSLVTGQTNKQGTQLISLETVLFYLKESLQEIKLEVIVNKLV